MNPRVGDDKHSPWTVFVRGPVPGKEEVPLMFRSPHTLSKALIGAAFALAGFGGIATAAASSAQAQTVAVWHQAPGFPNGQQSHVECDTCVIAII